MLLNGIVDAAVQGGISNWKHFYADDYGDTDKEKGFVRRLKDLTKEQVGDCLPSKLCITEVFVGRG